MARLLLLAVALTAPALNVLAQGLPPIKVPGLGTCPDSCISIRDGARGALIACCGDAEGCIDCTPQCVAVCNNGGNGRYGSCVDLGNKEDTCNKGCELLCDSPNYTICSIDGRPIDPPPEGCPYS